MVNANLDTYTAHFATQQQELDQKKHQVKTNVDTAIDALLDDEIDHYDHCKEAARQRNESTFAPISWLRGFYYLTLAKFTNPVAYRMAWRLIEKIDYKKSEQDYPLSTATASVN